MKFCGMAKEEAIRFWWQSAFWIMQGSLPLGNKNSVNRDSIVFSRWQHVSWHRFESSGRFQLLLVSINGSYPTPGPVTTWMDSLGRRLLKVVYSS